MRLNRLDLTRYGKFTDHVIDFGKPAAGQPDLHIIYGPNEAGKSTAFAAYLDLLFGIEPRSRFDFIHPYPTMRIGASLETAEGTRELVRIKRPQKSLLDSNDRPIAESLVLNGLGGLDRNAYRAMFSLDDETLEEGGEDILASKGDLGQLLFSASTGLADLSRALVLLRAEADGFYKYRARSGELQELKTQLAALKEERERIDTFASEYAQLVAARDGARAKYEEAIAERGAIQSRIDEIQRHLSALPRLAALRTIREKLLPLADLPEAPSGWLEDLPKLQTAEIELATRAEGVEAEIKQISAEIEAIAVDHAALRLAGRIDDLAERRARYVTAGKDLPERRLQMQELGLTISGILTRLGRAGEADPASLVLSASAIGALRDLIETRSGIEASAEAAQREFSEAKDRLEEARARQQEATGGTSGECRNETQMAALAAAIAALRGGDVAAGLRFAERTAKSCRESLAERMAALRPWAGNSDQLAELAVPQDGDIERWKDALELANKLIDRNENEIERLEAERRRVQAELDTISRLTGVVSEQDTASVRAEREEAWANHRRQLDEASAAAFEVALRRDDVVVNAQLRHEQEMAKLQQASATLAILEADIKTASGRLDAAVANRRTIHDELAALLLAMTPRLPDTFSLAQLEAWLARRDQALEARASLKRAERELQEAEADIDAARRTLASALDELGLPYDADASFEALLAKAQSAIDQETELKSVRAAVRDRARDVKSRERAFQKASDTDRSWRTAWAEACAACWLGEGGATPAVAAVREMLGVLADLGPSLEKRAGLSDRIAKMESDQVAFAGEVAAIVGELGLDGDGDVLDLAGRINDRFQQARLAQSAKAARSEARTAARARQRKLAEALAIHEKRKAEVISFFQVVSLAGAAAKLQEIAKRAELLNRAEEAERDIVEAMRLPAIEAAEAVLDAADRTALETELTELKARFEDEDRRTHELYASHRAAADRVEAVGGDSAAAKIEEKRRTVLLDVEERALRYLRLRAGIVAAEQALHIYREKHRSSMMAHASSAFQTISRGAYRSLMTQLEKDSEILIAVAADGSSKVASELSKGTRFQLYLALRVAGYYEFAQSRRPVPFIADDIMETFDEFRAEETFKVFAEMAQIGQVIYLTHHLHLCEIAKRICPGVRVHDLTSARTRTEAMTSAA